MEEEGGGGSEEGEDVGGICNSLKSESEGGEGGFGCIYFMCICSGDGVLGQGWS